ncbi:MAG TPA: hypothetical protein PKD61_09745 [Polyangiaceae bacterium]|nr:hypothetical protein [Polyangiaceae bacterium]
MTENKDGASRPVRDAHGRFVKGNPGGPGREPGFNDKLDFLAETKRWAARKGKTIQEVAAAVAGAVIQKAINGDAAAQRLACDRLFGVLPRDPVVAIQANHFGPQGPPVPPGPELLLNLSELAKLIIEDEDAKGPELEVLSRSLRDRNPLPAIDTSTVDARPPEPVTGIDASVKALPNPQG